MNLQNHKISNILLILQIFIFFYFVFILYDKISFLLNFDYYFDLAENENLLLINFYQHNLDHSLENLIKNGIIPIYPDFYHRIISLFPGDILLNSRQFNLAIYLLLIILVTLFSYYKNKSSFLLVCIPIILFDHHTNTNYLIINRVDALMIFFGGISLILNFLYYEELNKFKRILILIIFTFFSFSAFLTKQPAVLFIIISATSIIFKNNSEKFKDLIIFFLLIAIYFYLYFYFINRDIIEYFLIGYYLYNEKSLIHFFRNVILFFSNGTFILFLILYFSEKKKLFKNKEIISVVLFTILITFGLFFNQGAIHNNFFLFNLVFLIIIIYKKIYFTNFFKFLLLALTSVYIFSPTFFNFQKKVYLEKINYSNYFPKNMIDKQSKILTNRHDYFLYKNKKNVFLDGSSYFQIDVVDKLINSKFINKNTIFEIIELDKSLKKNVNNGFFDYIVDYNSNILIKFPEIKNNYKKIKHISLVEVYEKKK